MNLLLTGANGYIGLRLLSTLLAQGHRVTAVVRDKKRFPLSDFSETYPDLTVIEGDFSAPEKLPLLPRDIAAAYYLVRASDTTCARNAAHERQAAEGFVRSLARTRCKRVIALSTLVPTSPRLPAALQSKLDVEDVLRSSKCPTTILRSSWIIGAGSGNFEFIRSLAEPWPFLVAPRWMRSRCQPIAIRNVIDYLTGVLDLPETMGETYEIGGPEILTLSEMIRSYAKVRDLKRFQIPIPLRVPWLSARGLSLCTSANRPTANTAIQSLKYDSVCQDDRLQQLIHTPLFSYQEAVRRTLCCFAQNRAPSSWLKYLRTGKFHLLRFDQMKVPHHGTSSFQYQTPLSRPHSKVLEFMWTVDREHGWPATGQKERLWETVTRKWKGERKRTYRTDTQELQTGGMLGSWRVLLAHKERGRLILFSDHKMPGEAWWEFTFDQLSRRNEALSLTCTFRPRGIAGRIYWLFARHLHKARAASVMKKITTWDPTVPACSTPDRAPYSVNDVRSASSPQQW